MAMRASTEIASESQKLGQNTGLWVARVKAQFSELKCCKQVLGCTCFPENMFKSVNKSRIMHVFDENVVMPRFVSIPRTLAVHSCCFHRDFAVVNFAVQKVGCCRQKTMCLVSARHFLWLLCIVVASREVNVNDFHCQNEVTDHVLLHCQLCEVLLF